MKPLRDSITADGTNLDAFEPRDWTLLLFAGFVWGASFIFIAAGVDHFSPGLVTFGRVTIGAVTLGLFRKARTIKIDREDWARVVLVAITWLAFPMTLFPIAQQYISSGLAGMLSVAVPLFAAIITSIGLRRLPGRAQRWGLLVGGVGIVLLGLPTLSEGGSSALGVVLILIACLSYGIAVTINVPLAQKYGALPTFWRAQMIAVVLTAPYGLWGAANGSEWNLKSAAAVLVLGTMGTAVAFVAMVVLSARVGATRASGLTYFEAIIALALGVIVLSEPIQPVEVLGCAVLLGGAWLISRADMPARRDHQEELAEVTTLATT